MNGVIYARYSTANSLTEQEKALLAFYRTASEEGKQEIIQFVMTKRKWLNMPKKTNTRRADGRIVVQVYVGSVDGKRKYKSVYGKTQ